MSTLAVVVPTYRRDASLRACLAALAAQTRPPEELVVVTRVGDPDSAATARAAWPTATVLELEAPGVLAAMVAGTRATTCDVVCFTDDDAVAPPSWLARLEAALATPTVGGAGGRDVLLDGDRVREEATTANVGRLLWYGRHVGNHHRGHGPPRDVAFLKGVNAAYRRDALALPSGLRGEGAEAHFEVAVGRYARSRGYRLVYDPTLTVEHRPAARQGEDQRAAPASRAVADAAYNLVVAIGGWRGLCRVGYATLVGDRGAPGLARGVWALVTRDAATARRLWPSVKGTLAGGLALVRGRGVAYVTFD